MLPRYEAMRDLVHQLVQACEANSAGSHELPDVFCYRQLIESISITIITLNTLTYIGAEENPKRYGEHVCNNCVYDVIN